MKISAVCFGNKKDEFVGKILDTLEELSEGKVGVADENGFKDDGADGYVLFVPVTFGSPNAACKSFFERLAQSGAGGAFSGKNCMCVLTGDVGDGRYAFDALSRLLSYFGAFDAVRLSSGADDDLADKLTEDYYRILRQNRRYNVAKPTEGNIVGGAFNESPRDLTEDEEIKLLGGKKRQTAAELLIKRSGADSRDGAKAETEDAFGGEDLRNITEITRHYVEKFKKTETDGLTRVSETPNPLAGEVKPHSQPAPRVRTVKQMTLALPHCYNPQLAQGLTAVFQISVTGREAFDCYVTVDNTECEAAEGTTERKDITVNATETAWADVLKGKYTAQKAFMTGQLKVRGNFMLLQRFDQLFRLNMV